MAYNSSMTFDEEVKDSVTGKVNELLTPGGVLEVWENNIKIAGDNPDCDLNSHLVTWLYAMKPDFVWYRTI